MSRAADLAAAILATVTPTAAPAAASTSLLLTDAAPAPTVAEWLEQARSAHAWYRRALADGDASAADFSLQRAAVARAQAERADPEHTDRAWDHSGVVMMAAEVTHGDLHDDLLEFYAQQLKLEV